MSRVATPSTSSEPHSSYGFGLERIGLLAARAPWVAVVFVVAFSALSAFGITNLAPQGSLSELFRSDTPAFKTYERLRERFPTSEFDVLVVVEGENLATPKGLETARTLHLEMEFAEGVAGVLSVFSMRGRPDADGYPPPIVPVELPQGPEFDRVFNEITNAEMVKNRFLAAGSDGAPPLAVLVVSLALETLSREAIDTALTSIRSTLDGTLAGSGMRAELSGAPIMQSEIRSAIKRDRLIFNTAGFLVGFLICWFFLRRGVFVLITSICPPLAVLWAMGMLGLFDIRLNTFVNVIPPLVMVIAFSDSMHMTFSVRRALMNGATPLEAAMRAVRNVGPACALTSLTTALALFAMMVTDSSLIRQFGIGAGMATLLAFLAVITIVPTVTVLLCRQTKPADGETAGGSTASPNEMATVAGSASGIIEQIERYCRAIAVWVTHHQRKIVAVTIPFFVVCLGLHLSLQPNYALSDEVPTTNSSIKTAKLLESRLSGAQPLHIMVTWPQDRSIASPEVLAALEAVHDLQARQPAVTNVWSIDTLRRWLVENDVYSDEKLREYIADLPEHLRIRFLNEEARALVVTGRVGTVNASDSVPIMGRIDSELDALRQQYPGFTFDVSGFVALSSMASADMIGQLKLGLLTAIIIVVALIGVAFRSLWVAVISFIPNLMPIVLAGAFLYVTGAGLAYASVVALTVAFGLAVDDTIHFLSRYDKERQRTPDMTGALANTLEKVGPVLVLTTLVLLSGLAVTVFSALPALQTFGMLVMVTLGAALIADLFALPAIMLLADKARKALSR